MTISEVTRRNIIDELYLNKINLYGRLEEIEFLQRVVDLKNLPSNDIRYKDMAGDIYQHRINNADWGDNWVFYDERLNLFSNDELFLKFICEVINPAVRNNDQEVQILLNIFNKHLVNDGWKITEQDKLSGKPVFKAIDEFGSIKVENIRKITHDFAREQLIKCEKKVRGDPDGAITNARSLIEGVIADIYEKITGCKMSETGDLKSDYKQIKSVLNLVPDKYTSDSIKQILGGFIAIIDGIDSLSNKMGDRHRRHVKPEKHHAKLCVNSAKTITDFLYDTYTYQSGKLKQHIT